MKLNNYILIVASAICQNLSAQYRLIKAHSVLEDRIISMNLDEFNSMRFNIQSPELIQKLLTDTDSIKSFKNAHFWNEAAKIPSSESKLKSK